MVQRVGTVAFQGIDAVAVDVQVQVAPGLPAFNVKLYAVNAAGECAGAALYGGDAKTALAELQKARQDDPFIQLLMAQAYEKLGDAENAAALYKKAAAATAHNPPAAYARPFAAKKLKR